MGNGCSKGGPKHVVIDPTTQPGQSQGGHRHRASVYENILGFEHSSNINRQYDSYFEYFGI